MFNWGIKIRIHYNEKQKYAGNEVTYDVPNFNVSKVFECGWNNPDLSYERAYMATEGNWYFTDILDTLNKYQYRHSQILSSKKLKEAVLRVMEQGEKEIKHNIRGFTEIGYVPKSRVIFKKNRWCPFCFFFIL